MTSRRAFPSPPTSLLTRSSLYLTDWVRSQVEGGRRRRRMILEIILAPYSSTAIWDQHGENIARINSPSYPSIWKTEPFSKEFFSGLINSTLLTFRLQSDRKRLLQFRSHTSATVNITPRLKLERQVPGGRFGFSKILTVSIALTLSYISFAYNDLQSH